jgi:hypothetical protein
MTVGTVSRPNSATTSHLRAWIQAEGSLPRRVENSGARVKRSFSPLRMCGSNKTRWPVLSAGWLGVQQPCRASNLLGPCVNRPTRKRS